jgi:hypothetical protein
MLLPAFLNADGVRNTYVLAATKTVELTPLARPFLACPHPRPTAITPRRNPRTLGSVSPPSPHLYRGMGMVVIGSGGIDAQRTRDGRSPGSSGRDRLGRHRISFPINAGSSVAPVARALNRYPCRLPVTSITSVTFWVKYLSSGRDPALGDEGPKEASQAVSAPQVIEVTEVIDYSKERTEMLRNREVGDNPRW